MQIIFDFISVLFGFLIKAKYKIVEPYYMEESTPDQLARLVGEPY